MAFGAGIHLCIGAPHARLIVRTLLERLAAKVSRIEVREARERIEREVEYERIAGWERLVVGLSGRAS